MRSSHVWRALFEVPKLISWFQYQASRQTGTMYRRHLVFFILVGSVLLLPSALFAESPEYRVIEIPIPVWGGCLSDDSSVVAGTTPDMRLWTWADGVVTYLPIGGSISKASVMAVNNSSTSVGWISDSSSSWGINACMWPNGTLRILDGGPCCVSLWVMDINTSGTMIGKIRDTAEDRQNYPFIYSGSGLVSPLRDPAWLEFHAINDANAVAARSWSIPDQFWRACVYHDGTVSILGGPNSSAYDINNSNHVLGEDGSGGFCLWKDGTQIPVGLRRTSGEYATGGLNDFDVIVGYTETDGHRSAAVWQDGITRDLNTLIDPDLGIYLGTALDINNKGEILCNGTGGLYLLVPDTTITVRDANNDAIPNVEFNLIKVANNPPVFTEDTLGSFTTDGDGRLELTKIAADTFEVSLSTGTKQLVVGDSLKISKHVHSIPAAKHAGVLGTMYSIHLDNAHFAKDGHMYFDRFTGPGQEMKLNHTELRYNLLVSVEWDAALSYLGSLGAGLKAMSNYLYDVSDGQIRLDTVAILDNKAFWNDADIKIYASNMVHPHVDLLNGIVRSGPSGAPVEMPRKWFGNSDACRNGTYTENPLNLEDNYDVRTKCHELGHYALNFGDEYRFADGSGGLVDEIGRCGSVANYGFMDHPFEGYGPLASEMSSIYQYADGACRNTQQFLLFFGSCWDHLEEQYEWEWGSASIFVPIITPDDAERELPDGFNYLPGPNGEMFVLDYNVGALVQFPVEQFPPDLDIVTLEVQVETPTHRVSKADVNLINHFNTSPKKIYQGQTDDGHGRIWVVGASESDHLIQATSGLAVELTGNLPHAAASTGKVWMCGEESIGGTKEKGVSNLSWSAGDSVVIQLREVQGDYPLICGVSLGDDTATYHLDLLNPFSAPPKADLLPDAGGFHSYDFTIDGSGYAVSMSDSLGGSGTITVWAKDDLSQDFFFSTNYTVAEFDTGAAMWNLMGPLGEAEVWIDTSNATLQKGVILSSPYLIIRTGLTDVNIQAGEAHSLSVYPPTSLSGHNQFVIRYADSDLDAGTGIVGREMSLQVFFWNGGSHQWEPIGGSVDTIQNVVSAVISDVGVYAAFTTEVVTGIEDDERGDILPYKFELSQNYPNPFNPVTTIEYSVPSRTEVTIEIFNVLGQKVRTLVSDTKAAGSYRIEWSGTDESGRSVSTGVYLYRFQAGDVVQTKKMLLLK